MNAIMKQTIKPNQEKLLKKMRVTEEAAARSVL